MTDTSRTRGQGAVGDCASVSAVIPCFNGEKYLRETLESAVGQTHGPVEILVVDDGSTDDSAAIAESFGPPVRVIRQENQGESVARNRGIDEAQGAWVAFLDADDVWERTKLEKQLAAATTSLVAVHTDIRQFGTVERELRIREEFGEERYNVERLAVRNCIPCPSSMIVRREACPRFPEWTKDAEDQVFMLELVRRGPVALVEEPLTRYRVHSASQSQANRNFATVRWHRTIARWLSEQDWISQDSLSEIEVGWERKLLRALNNARRTRAWDEHKAIRDYLSEVFGDRPAVRAALGRRTYPAWAYRAADGLRRVRRAMLGKSLAR